MTIRQTLAAVLGAALMTTAISAATFAQDETVLYPAEGVEWRLDPLASANDGILADVPAGVEVTLELSDGDATGSAGCNTYFGGYVIDATSLSFETPFATTRQLCEGAAQAIEDAYLPLLEAVAAWTIDAEGTLRLSDAAGTVTLVYREAPVDVTATDVESLATELVGLQVQIDQVEADIAALAQTAAAGAEEMDARITANEEAIAEIETTIEKFRNRINKLEESVAEIETTIEKFRNRINKLEDSAEDQEARITALEGIAADHEARIAALEASTP